MNLPIWKREGRQPTPREWVVWYETLPDEEKLKAAEQIIQNSQDAYECILNDHKGQIDELLFRERKGAEDS